MSNLYTVFPQYNKIKQNNNNKSQKYYNYNGVCRDEYCTNFNQIRSYFCDNCCNKVLKHYDNIECVKSCKFYKTNKVNHNADGICSGCLDKLHKINTFNK